MDIEEIGFQESHSDNDKKQRRKEAHTQAEKKRRDSIRRGYDELAELVPACRMKDPFMTQKLSKATILQNTIDHIQVISEKKDEDEKQLERLHREVKGMKIMLNELGGMIKKQRAVPAYQSYHRSSDNVKLESFKTICNELFESFDQEVNVESFGSLSRDMFVWSDRHLRQDNLSKIVGKVIDEEIRFASREAHQNQQRQQVYYQQTQPSRGQPARQHPNGQVSYQEMNQRGYHPRPKPY